MQSGTGKAVTQAQIDVIFFCSTLFVDEMKGTASNTGCFSLNDSMPVLAATSPIIVVITFSAPGYAPL